MTTEERTTAIRTTDGALVEIRDRVANIAITFERGALRPRPLHQLVIDPEEQP